MCARSALVALVLSVSAGCAGSASFATVPRTSLAAAEGAPDPKRAQTDGFVQARLDRKPLASFPAVIAVVRVAPCARGEPGKYRIVHSRDFEKPEAFDRLKRMAMVAGIAPISRLSLPDFVSSSEEIRSAAAAVNADMVLMYSVDVSQEAWSPAPGLDVLTIGLVPMEEARAAADAAAVLLDTRNGYVYGSAEASARKARPANAWVMEGALAKVTVQVREEAADRLTSEIETLWAGVVKNHVRTR